MVFLFRALFLVVSTLIQSSIANQCHCGAVQKSERELKADIFQNYDADVRPVKNPTTAVAVNISMTPLKVKSMNEKDQVISLETWLGLTWEDEYLHWDPTEYNSITELRVKHSQVWTPDIAVYSASPETTLFPTVHTRPILHGTGELYWVAPFTINSRCPMPSRNCTIAEAKILVECSISMGAWTYSGKQMDVRLMADEVDLTNFQDNNREWKLVKIRSTRSSLLYPSIKDEYPIVYFNITLERRY